jgi:threonine dehydrogenase-like Zn-dependent dehydrogenase
MMKAAVFEAPGMVRLEDVPIPRPGPGQALVRVRGCGVCGSDLPVWSGRPWFSYPRDPGAPGHETWGIVESVAAEVTAVKPGDAVAGLSYHGYAEWDVADAAYLVRLPRELSGQPFPGEALGCALNVFRRSRIQPGQTVAIVGIGFLGALITQLCSRSGAQVIAISRRRSALATARQMGATEALAMEEPVAERIGSLTGGRLCDVVIEAAGLQATLDLAASITGVSGRLVIAGFHQDGPRQVDMALWNWRGLDVINAHERDPSVVVEAIRVAAQAVVSGALDPGPLYTDRFPLSALSSALEAASTRPAGFMKALVMP